MCLKVRTVNILVVVIIISIVSNTVPHPADNLTSLRVELRLSILLVTERKRNILEIVNSGCKKFEVLNDSYVEKLEIPRIKILGSLVKEIKRRSLLA